MAEEQNQDVSIDAAARPTAGEAAGDHNEAGAPAAAAPPKPKAPAAPAAPRAPHIPEMRVQPMAGNWWWGTGRRKAAVARVRIKPGTGKAFVNKRDLDEYFKEERDRKDIYNVLDKTNTRTSVDIHVSVSGGGFTGQAGAIQLGLGRALNRYDQTLEPILRDNDFLTRDPRRVERKKYGQRGARRRFQFSKR